MCGVLKLFVSQRFYLSFGTSGGPLEFVLAIRVMLYLFIQLHNAANPSKVHLCMVKAMEPAQQQDFPQTGVVHPKALGVSPCLCLSENPSGFWVYWIQLHI